MTKYLVIDGNHPDRGRISVSVYPDLAELLEAKLAGKQTVRAFVRERIGSGVIGDSSDVRRAIYREIVRPALLKRLRS